MVWSRTGLCGIRSRALGSTVEGLFSKVLKCSFHRAFMLFLSFRRVVPSADISGVVHGFAGPYAALIALKNILLFCASAYCCTSSAFLSHHSSCILRSDDWVSRWRRLKRSRFELEQVSFCHSTKAFCFSARSADMVWSFSSNQSWWTRVFGPMEALAESVTMDRNCSHFCDGSPVRGPCAVMRLSRSCANSSRRCSCSSLATLKAGLTTFGVFL